MFLHKCRNSLVESNKCFFFMFKMCIRAPFDEYNLVCFKNGSQSKAVARLNSYPGNIRKKNAFVLM